VALTLIKLQKLDQNDSYHFMKVVGVIALASGLNLVPYFGRYLSSLTLALGLKMVTRSPYVDVAFTIVISGGIMFLVNLFIIGTLMGDLRPSMNDDGDAGPSVSATQEPASDAEPEAVAPTNPPAHPAAAPAAAKPAPAKPAPAGPKHLAIKGLTRNGAKSVIIIDSGLKTYTLFLGDSAAMETADGTKSVRFESLDADSVTLNVDGQPLKLSAH
jgi:hypothetical protein